jgi:hypothetical protein
MGSVRANFVLHKEAKARTIDVADFGIFFNVN